MEDAYARSVSEVLDFFGVDSTKGLTDFQVSQHARLYGKNVFPEEERTPFWKLVFKQFDDFLVKILIAAAFISFLLALINGETGLTAFLEPSVILLILAANAAVGVITETNAEKALEELRAYQADIATVLRNGCFSILPATELVPGDIVEASVGSKVPADMRMIEMLTGQLRVDQAILTGESSSVEKDPESTIATNAVYQDKTNILFSGTVVVAGRARAVVIGVGANTAMGSIRDSMLRTDDVSEAVVTGWLFFRYLVIGAYVGLATVAGFIWWFIYSETGPKLPYSELMNFDTCPTRETAYPCSIFEDRHPSTVSMTVLVVVEMFNALNNLSENQSLLVIPPWSNLWLVASIIITMLLHMLILYIPPLATLFSVAPLSWNEWTVILYLSFPVIIIDEILKFFSRNYHGIRFNFRFRRFEALPKKESRDK